MAECIDGRTGLEYDYFGAQAGEGDAIPTNPSLVSTVELLRLFWEVNAGEGSQETIETLEDFCDFKREVSPEYETAKDELLSNHRVFRQWKRRREYKA